MEFLTQLWLPIVVSAVIVFFASSVLWMALPLHKKDYSTPPNEEAVLSLLREHSFTPGQYFLPWCGGGDMKDPAFQAKMKAGPWAMLTVMSQAPSFGRCLGQWFASQLVIASLIAYPAAAAIQMGSAAPPYLRVFQIVGSIALLAHCGMAGHNSIWRGVPWRITFTQLFDGVIYALLTAGTFAWLWPRAAGG